VTTALNGVLGGLVAALATAAAAALRGAGPSTTARALADRFGGPATAARYRLTSVAAHLGYGALVGGSLVVVDQRALNLLSVPPGLGPALGAAVGWAIRFGASTVAIWAASGVDVDRERLVSVFAAHVTLGVLLGLWIYATWIT
jgi:hypothetical protein